jgi:signal transduction histidine kinase
MDAVTASAGLAHRQTVVRPEPRGPEPVASGPDSGRRALPDLARLVDCLIKVLESERTRVSAVLGDEVVSVVTMARYLIEDATQRLARGELEEGAEALQNASARMRDATGRLVALCSDLHPRVLDDLGLVAALSWYFRDFSQENRTIFLSPRVTVREDDVPGDLRLAIFRVVQAALSNVARHSKASTVRVFLSVLEDELRLGVEDDGVGFDLERWRHRRIGQDGCGLTIILRWVESSGGRCRIETTPRHGARVLATWRVRTTAAQAGPSEPAQPAASPADTGT